MYPFMTKRIFHVPFETFQLLLNTHKHEVDSLPESDFKTSIKALGCGCFVVVTKVGEREEALVMHRHFTHINSMVGDLNLHKMQTCLNKHF